MISKQKEKELKNNLKEVSKKQEKIEKEILKKQEKIEKGMKGVQEEIKDLRLSKKRKAAKFVRINKKVRWPETIDILGNTWKIELSEYLEKSEKLHGVFPEKLNGLCQYKTRTIFLCLTCENLLEIFLHEIIHAIDYEFGVCLSELWKLKKNKHFNEFRVSTLAKIWLNVFKVLKGDSNAKVDAK